MPELPEAETIAADLRILAGATITAAVTLHPPTAAGPLPLSALEGERIASTYRRGKCVVIGLEGGLALLASLRMTGQFLFGRGEAGTPPAGEAAGRPAAGKPAGPGAGSPGARPAAGPPDARGWPPHVRAAFLLDGPRGPAGEDALLYRDIRTFGRLYVAPAAELDRLHPAGAAAADALSLSEDDFHRRLSSSRAPVKTVMMDQSVMGGIGNIYATEILFAAGISPGRTASGISRPESDRIRRAAREILAEAIARRGSTVENYRAPLGPGTYQELHRAYGRAGLPCPRCGRPLQRAVIAGRGTVWCPGCQK
ncbi:MAG: hypothetical protein LBG06_04540 [Deltaproteobacteria bacterium]|nr:hypothetical protein [Deltaproteobacteria bacterium]